MYESIVHDNIVPSNAQKCVRVVTALFINHLWTSAPEGGLRQQGHTTGHTALTTKAHATSSEQEDHRRFTTPSLSHTRQANTEDASTKELCPAFLSSANGTHTRNLGVIYQELNVQTGAVTQSCLILALVCHVELFPWQ